MRASPIRLVTGRAMTLDPDLANLAHHFGIATEYWDQGRTLREISAEVIVEILESFGVDARSAAGRRAALRRVRRVQSEVSVPAVLVFRRPGDGGNPWQVCVRAPVDSEVRVWVELEAGGVRSDLGEPQSREDSRDGESAGTSDFVCSLPPDLPLGWHGLCADIDGRVLRGALVICPERLEFPRHSSGRRAWGVAAQLYAARSERSWGLGDLGDLRDLAWWTGTELGADFTLVNPLHSAAPVAQQAPSPYLPVTRRYANPIYVRVEMIDEFAYVSPVDRDRIEKLSDPLRETDRVPDLLDRAAVWEGKRQALEIVYGESRSVGREARYRAYLNREGEALEKFALWCAIAELHGPRWDQWPPELQSAQGERVAKIRAELASRVEFHRWLQWVLDEQMSTADRAAREAGMCIGVVHDLAVGVHRFGSDTWTDPDLFAADVSVGAPPDGFNQVGQDWSQPPWRPDRLAESAYVPFREMLRTQLRHCGGLRIDHILGLFRLWWIPGGRSPADGTYVRYDHQAMLDILVLEAHRAGAVIVGEDLGTVEPWVAECLAERGILGTDVLWFERDGDGLRPPERWRTEALVAVTVHDLPPTLAYLRGSHVRLRAELGLLARPEREELAAHEREIGEWRKLLASRGLVRPGASDEEMVVALHRLAAWSPALMLAVALPDLCGDVRTQNQPGTDNEYPNWRLPLCGPDGQPVLLDDLPERPELAAIVDAIGGRAGHRVSRS